MIRSVSDHLREKGKRGLVLRPEEVQALLKNLATAREIASETEEELTIISKLYASRNNTAHSGQDIAPNVIRLLRRPRPRVVSISGDGGDAA